MKREDIADQRRRWKRSIADVHPSRPGRPAQRRAYFRPRHRTRDQRSQRKHISADDTTKHLVIGELALDGRVRPVKGALSAAILAKEQGHASIIVPNENAQEAAVVEGIDVIPVTSLTQAVGSITGELGGDLAIEPVKVDLDKLFHVASKYDFGDVR